MKRWKRKVETAGARMELCEMSDGEWVCLLVPADTPDEPILRPYSVRSSNRFRDDAIRAALAAYDPEHRTYAEQYAAATGGLRHPW